MINPPVIIDEIQSNKKVKFTGNIQHLMHTLATNRIFETMCLFLRMTNRVY